jgi:AcrR family transcriptional regulator
MSMTEKSAAEGKKKERIIAATIKLWRQAHKINKVSLEEIAREAGVSPTTIYNNFGTREGLVQEVIRHISREIINKMQTLLKSDQPYPLKMQGMVAAKLNTVSGMQADIIEKIWSDPDSRRYIEEITESQAKPLMKAIIEEGQREGYIHPDISPELFILYFNILKAGTEANKQEVAQLSSDRSSMYKIARLMYFGIFRKEFDISTGNPVREGER